MAYDKWHNLNNQDECVQNKYLNVETGKLHVKNLFRFLTLILLSI